MPLECNNKNWETYINTIQISQCCPIFIRILYHLKTNKCSFATNKFEKRFNCSYKYGINIEGNRVLTVTKCPLQKAQMQKKLLGITKHQYNKKVIMSFKIKMFRSM